MNVLQNLGTLSAQVFVLTVLIVALTGLLHTRLTARARCWVWGLVVLRLCLPVSIEAPFSMFNLLRPASSALEEMPLPPQDVAPRVPAPTPPSPTVTSLDRPPVAPMSQNAAVGAIPPVQVPQARLAPASRYWIPSISGLVLTLWGLGVLALWSRTAWLAFRMHRLVAAGRPVSSPALLAALEQARNLIGVRKTLSVRSLPGLDSPALYGALRPTLLVPPDLEQRLRPEQLRHVLLHECAHVRRQDIALNWILAVLQALHWFNPAVWFAFSRLRAERELACDEIALEVTGQDDCEAYGQTLLHLLASWSGSASTSTPGAIGLFERHGDLRRRLRSIAEFRPGRRLGIPVAFLIALAGAVTLTDAQSPSAVQPPTASVTATNLPPVIPLRYTNALVAPENRDLSSGGNWSKVPRGSNVLGGVHFEIDGLIQLASRNSVAGNRGFRDFVTLSSPSRRYGSIHLLASAAWSAEPNRPIADVVWRYTDGSLARSPIVYGAHVRDFWRRPFETPRTVSSRFAKCAVSWTSPDAQRNQAALRFYRVTLPNPEPAKTVAYLQIQSSMEDASLMLLAVSLDPLEAGKRPDPSPDAEAKDPEWTRHLGVNLVEAATSKVIGGATVIATVTGSGPKVSRQFVANGSGVADVLLPTEPVTGVTLEASATNYASARVHLDINSTNPVPPFVTMRLLGGLRIGGRIVSTLGEPVVGARVVAARFFRGLEPDLGTTSSTTTEFQTQQVQTDTDGYWEMGSMPESLLDRIRIDVTHDDFGPAFIESPAMNPSVRSDLLARRHEIRLVPGAVVVGVVLNSEGRPVSEATVRVGRLHFQGTKEGRTDATGRFRIGGLTPEKTVISARAKGHGGVAEELTVSPKTPEVTLRLKQGRQFSGTVTDADHQPLADVTVYTEPGAPAGPFVQVDLARELRDFMTRTEADGSWTWEGGPDAEVQFSFSKEGYSRSEAGLQPGKPTTTVLQKVREVRGVIVDAETGDPVTQFRVEPRAHAFWSPSDGRDVTSSEGRFVLPIYDNSYERIQISSPTHEPVDEAIPEAVEGVIEMTFRLKKSGDWSGVVVDASGRPVPEAWVGLTRRQGELLLDGYRLRPVFPGSPMAVAGSEGEFKLRAIQDPSAVVAATAEGFGVTPSEEFQRHHRIHLLPYGTLQGVYHGDADPDGMVQLRLQLFSGGNAPSLGIILAGSAGQSIPANGRFEFTTIPPGNHKLFRVAQKRQNTEIAPVQDVAGEIRVVQKGPITEIIPLQDVVVEPGQTTTVEVGTP